MTDKRLKNLKKVDKQKFRDDLIGWFEREQRDLPWRKDQDPYKVWVSEIMLQQTRVDTVIPYFNRFLAQFPSISSLANAEEDKVLKAWEGLGYYSRVRNLQSAVREVKEKYQGIVPDNLKEISDLRGVGPYTAGAILSIAYGKPEPAVDGNVMRVMSRILLIWEDIAKPSSRKIFEDAVRELISRENPSAFNQGLMELGALICTPTSPSCLLCPVREHCQAAEEGLQLELPVKSKKKKQRPVGLGAVVFEDQEGRLLIHKRPPHGLLANLWEFPNFEVSVGMQSEKDQLKEAFAEHYGIQAELGIMIGRVEHIFTHLIWNINIFTGKVTNQFHAEGDLQWVTPEELQEYAFPVSHQKIFSLYMDHKQAE